jgi:hypothetical protein
VPVLPALIFTALAADPPATLPISDADAAEEIIVWGDRFARWERRWLVRTEVLFAPQHVLYAVTNHETRLNRLQIRAVLDCDKDIKLLAGNWEVNCTIEDIGLVGLVQRRGRDDLHVLEQTDAALTGARLQLQVSAEGGVANVDVEGLVPRNERDRLRIESYRQILSRVILPFHLGLPKVIHDGAKWYEYNSRLLSMPSQFASGGSTTIAHFLDEHEGYLLVQSLGEGVVRPVVGIDALGFDENGMASIADVPVDTYEVGMHGVALFDKDTGIMEERVWVFEGGLTPGSPNLLRGFRYAHTGHLRMLGQREAPNVGATYIARVSADDPGDAPLYAPLPLPH